MAHTSTDPLPDCIRHALLGSQRHLAEVNGKARRYRASVAPFAMVDETSAQASEDLAGLLAVGESVYLLGNMPAGSNRLRCTGVAPCLQMLFPVDQRLPDAKGQVQIEHLSCSDSAEMLELIAVAFPGYFREETCRMGRYFGVREGGKLIAMAGERMVLEVDGLVWREISALCTHPDHTGRGLGTLLLRHVIENQRTARAMSWLHVVEDNHRAIALYRQLGFQTLRRVELHRVTRDY